MQHRSSVRIQTQIRRVLGLSRVESVRHTRQTAATITLQRRARGWFGRVYARMYRIRLGTCQKLKIEKCCYIIVCVTIIVSHYVSCNYRCCDFYLFILVLMCSL